MNNIKVVQRKLLVTGSKGHYRIYDGVNCEDYLYYTKKESVTLFKQKHKPQFDISKR